MKEKKEMRVKGRVRQKKGAVVETACSYGLCA